MTTEQAFETVRLSRWGLKIDAALLKAALVIVEANTPPIPVFVPPPSFFEDDSERSDHDAEYREWTRAQDDYQDMLRR